MPKPHFFCQKGCALVQIIDKKLPENTRYIYSDEALNVARHPEFTRGGVRQQGPLFYVVECCQKRCPGMFRIDWNEAEQVQDCNGPWKDGLFVDFTNFVCPSCGKQACKACLKLAVATQVVVGGVDGNVEYSRIERKGLWGP